MKGEKGRKAIIFCNGDLADVQPVKKFATKNTLLVACDGGAKHALSLGLMPHVVIGDLDSIPKKIEHSLLKKGVEFVRYPKDKLYTDTELGVMLAQERGCKEIILTGVRGTHSDHFIANVGMLAKKKYLSLNFRVIDGKEEMVLIRKRITMKGKRGETVSLIAIGADANGVTTKGLFYPLKNATLKAWSSQGLRNHMTAATGSVRIRSGSLLVIRQR